MADFPEASLQVYLLLLILRRLEKLLRRFVPVGEVVSVQDTHVMNTVCPYLAEVASIGSDVDRKHPPTAVFVH